MGPEIILDPMIPFSFQTSSWLTGRRQWLLSAFLFAALSLQPASAQEPLFLWKATSAVGEVYLLGSIHFAKPEMYPLDARIEEAFADSDNVVVEVDISAENELAQQALALQLGMYKDGTTIKDHISPESFERFEAFLQKKGMPLMVFQAFRPWTAAATLQVLEMQRMGFQAEIGIERHFLRQAEEQGKAVHELETAEFQLRMLAEMPEDLQEMFLMSTVDEYEVFEERMDDMLTAWKTGDAAALEGMLLEGYEDKPELHPLYQRIVIDRNVGMAEKVIDMLKGGGTWFVIAGAAHMVGEQGVAELVKQDAGGFEIVQVGAVE